MEMDLRHSGRVRRRHDMTLGFDPLSHLSIVDDSIGTIRNYAHGATGAAVANPPAILHRRRIRLAMTHGMFAVQAPRG